MQSRARRLLLKLLAAAFAAAAAAVGPCCSLLHCCLLACIVCCLSGNKQRGKRQKRMEICRKIDITICQLFDTYQLMFLLRHTNFLFLGPAAFRKCKNLPQNDQLHETYSLLLMIPAKKSQESLFPAAT
jgi:hypothetical protein